MILKRAEAYLSMLAILKIDLTNRKNQCNVEMVIQKKEEDASRVTRRSQGLEKGQG